MPDQNRGGAYHCEACRYTTNLYASKRAHLSSHKHARNTQFIISKDAKETIEMGETIKQTVEVTTVPIEKYNEALAENNKLKEEMKRLHDEAEQKYIQAKEEVLELRLTLKDKQLEYLQETNAMLKVLMKL